MFGQAETIPMYAAYQKSKCLQNAYFSKQEMCGYLQCTSFHSMPCKLSSSETRLWCFTIHTNVSYDKYKFLTLFYVSVKYKAIFIFEIWHNSYFVSVALILEGFKWSFQGENEDISVWFTCRWTHLIKIDLMWIWWSQCKNLLGHLNLLEFDLHNFGWPKQILMFSV